MGRSPVGLSSSILSLCPMENSPLGLSSHGFQYPFSLSHTRLVLEWRNRLQVCTSPVPQALTGLVEPG